MEGRQMEKEKCFCEKLVDIGLGSFFYIRDKAGKIIAEIAQEGEKHKGDFGNRKEEISKTTTTYVRKWADKILDTIGVATKKDVEELKKRMEKEEQK